MIRILAHASLDIVEDEHFTIDPESLKVLRRLLNKAMALAEQHVIDYIQEYDGGVYVVRENKDD